MDEAEVREESSPETNEEQVEQREDDYQGLTRRMEDMLSKLDRMETQIEALIGQQEANAAMFVENGGAINDEMQQSLADTIETKLDEVLGIDALDLM